MAGPSVSFAFYFSSWKKVQGSDLLFSHPTLLAPIPILLVSRTTSTATWILGLSVPVCSANLSTNSGRVSLPPFILWKGLIPLITQTAGLTLCAIILHDTAFFGFHSKTFIIANVQGIAAMLDLCSIQVSPWKIAWSWKNPCLLYKCLPWDPSKLFLPAYVWKEIKLRLRVSDHAISENVSARKRCEFAVPISTCT